MQEYQAYLLRLQRGQYRPHWRATLENAHTGEILHFVTERELLCYLTQICAYPPKHPHQSPTAGTTQDSNLGGVL